jgi:Galactose binding lectin domain
VVITAKEYCQFESFNATCSTNQVIVMEEARYGRLQLGRCVTRDYGYIGCSANVLDLLDRSCSGQRQCTFVIPTLRDLVQPCPKDLTSYLDATYKCVNGECACDFNTISFALHGNRSVTMQRSYRISTTCWLLSKLKRRWQLNITDHYNKYEICESNSGMR